MSLADLNSTTEALLNQAVQAHNRGDLAAATKQYESILAKNPEQADALHLLGVVHAQSQRPDDAIALINRAIGQRPRFSEALFNLGRIYQNENMPQDAVNAFVRAARYQNGYTAAWLSLGQTYTDVGMHEEALRAFEAGLSFEPDSEQLHDAICRVRKRQQEYSKCVDAADRGLRKLPDSARLWIHRSEACFALGRFPEAWQAYTWRAKHADNINRPRQYDLPHWNGENLRGKTLLVVTEQGPGETFLFSSTLPEIIERAEKCFVVTSARLIPILQRSFPDIVALDEVTTHEPPHGVDFQTSLVDLGAQLRPSRESFPDRTAHIAASPSRVAAFRKRYTQHKSGNLVVGLAWRSMGVDTASTKSIPLEFLKPILLTPGITFVSLQYGDVQSEVDSLCRSGAYEILTESDLNPVEDLEGHLAQVGAMDLVISTSNTAAHAAGSMGIPTWCLLPNLLGEGLRWIWLHEQNTCLWYPQTHLYKQMRAGDWTDPIARASADLVKLKSHKDTAFDSAQHLVDLAKAYQRAGQFNAMGLIAKAAVEQGTGSPDAYRLLSKWFRSQDKPQEGLRIVAQAPRAIAPAEDAKLKQEHAACLMDLHRFEDAADVLLPIRHERGENQAYWMQLSQAYRFAGRIGDALDAVDNALKLEPDSITARNAKALMMIDCGRMDEAISILNSVVEADPVNVEALAARGKAHLAKGDFKTGWPHYQNRLRKESANISYVRFPHPVWRGQSLEGANILVWTEQGIGEEILMSTMLPDLIAKARSVTLLCSERMVPVFFRSFPTITVEERLEPLSAAAVNPEIDFQMSLSDLGDALRPTADSFTHQKSAVLSADKDVTEDYRRRYKSAAGDRPLIGLSWHSTSPNIGPLKSLPVDIAKDLLTRSDAFFVSVQYAPDPEDLEYLVRAGNDQFLHDPSLDALASIDTALAQVAAMDTVVTVSNTTAHMAGALGVPTALLTPPETGRHWYWLRDHTASLWYDSVRLIETRPGLKWSDQIDKLAEDIRSFGRTRTIVGSEE